MNALRSPLTFEALYPDGHALIGASGERWPLIDDIAFLRADRRLLADQALTALDAGDVAAATAILLGDQDPWAPDPPPSEANRQRLVAQRDALNFREAMALLTFGPVADYFAHRWTDPTFLSGLALLQSHGGSPDRAFELACGAGHYLRELAPRVPHVTGADIVFAKLWLARHWIAPTARLLCFDAAGPWPIAQEPPALVFCHDAFYFLPNKQHIATEMRRLAGVDGSILIGHAHNALAENHSSGAPLAPQDYEALFSPALLYDDAELTRAFVEARPPLHASANRLEGSAAIAIVAGRTAPTTGSWNVPPDTRLVRNPIYMADPGGRVVQRFPSQLYADEYGALVTYPPTTHAPVAARAGEVDPDLIRRRVFVDLPERW